VKLTIYDESQCDNVVAYYEKDWGKQLCAGFLSGGKDTCQGDSGSGLFVKDSVTRKLILSGLVSYGEGES
jgi:secreted trypsin-like serine protease